MVDTIGETRKTLQAAGNVIRAVGRTNVVAGTGVLYRSRSAQLNYETNVSMGVDPFYLHLGLNDFVGGTSALSSFQQGYRFNPNLEARLGLFYSKPGLGLDWQPVEPLRLSTEFYDLNARRLDLLGSVSLPFAMKLMLRANHVGNQSLGDSSVGIGIGY